MEMHEPIKTALLPMTQAQLEELANKSGISFFTIRKIRDGETKNPGVLTCERLYRALFPEQETA